jgi:hypothetical protein
MLSELRQKFSFNITPFQQLSSSVINSPDNENVERPIVRINSDGTKPKVY